MPGTLVKKEILVEEGADGRLVKTTTKTVREDGGGVEIGFGGPGVDAWHSAYCCSPSAFLRWAQIIMGFIIVGCISSVYGTHLVGALAGQNFILVLTCLCVCITFLFLVIFCLGLHVELISELPWRWMDFGFSVLAALLFFIAGCMESYYAAGSWRTACKRSYVGGGEEIRSCPTYTAWIIAAVACFILSILYAIGAYLAYRRKSFL